MIESPTFRRPDGTSLPEKHHLSMNPRGKYVLRLTISVDGSKFVGRRIVVQLRTKDPQEAMTKRDVVIESFLAAGILCRDVAMTVE